MLCGDTRIPPIRFWRWSAVQASDDGRLGLRHARSIGRPIAIRETLDPSRLWSPLRVSIDKRGMRVSRIPITKDRAAPQRMKALTVGLILLTASVTGCASTTAESAGAAQDDATSSASSGAPATPSRHRCSILGGSARPHHRRRGPDGDRRREQDPSRSSHSTSPEPLGPSPAAPLPGQRPDPPPTLARSDTTWSTRNGRHPEHHHTHRLRPIPKRESEPQRSTHWFVQGKPQLRCSLEFDQPKYSKRRLGHLWGVAETLHSPLQAIGHGLRNAIALADARHLSASQGTTMTTGQRSAVRPRR